MNGGESLTCGGGSPPAPAGHSGSILLRPPQLQAHRGEGFSIDQLPLANMSVTLWETGGADHSSSTDSQVASLEHKEYKHLDEYSNPNIHWRDRFYSDFSSSVSFRNSQRRFSFHAVCSKPWFSCESSQKFVSVRILGYVITAETERKTTAFNNT